MGERGPMMAVATVTEFAELQEKLAGPDRLSELFHMVNRILPEDQVVVSVSADTLAGEALKLMQKHNFSQLPVLEGNSVLGLFSYRAFALEVANSHDPKVNPTSLPVEEFLEHDKPQYARLSDEFRGLISILDKKDSVVVSGPENLLGILTPMDVLCYFYDVASAYVLIEEIEVTLRALIDTCIPDDNIFCFCISNALSAKYGDRVVPERLEEMTFDDYIALLRDGRNWQYFTTVFGECRVRTKTKLEPIRDLRNDVFHFRRELSVEDHQQLSSCRNWLKTRIRKFRAKEDVCDDY